MTTMQDIEKAVLDLHDAAGCSVCIDIELWVHNPIGDDPTRVQKKYIVSIVDDAFKCHQWKFSSFAHVKDFIKRPLFYKEN